MIKKNIFLAIALISILSACSDPASTQEHNNKITEEAQATSYELVLASEVEWTHLNPKRGDKAPKAGTLWGDRNSTEPTGFLLKPTDGFSSPPHIHNVSYRGIVIQGLIHNDDPNAANMWMPAGSFWTQPKGEVHITSAKGTSTLAYIEIDEGPYLVLPAEEEFDSGERPVNVNHSNIVWLGADELTWVEQTSEQSTSGNPKVAFLWGDMKEGKLNGKLVKIPAGFAGVIKSKASIFKAVVIAGQPMYKTPDMSEEKTLDTGSYFGSEEGLAEHQISNRTSEECIVYVRTNSPFEILTKQK